MVHSVRAKRLWAAALCALAAALLIAPGAARAETADTAQRMLAGLDAQPLCDWALRETELDARDLMRRLVAGGEQWDAQDLGETLRAVCLSQIDWMAALVPALAAPGLILAVAWRVRGDGLSPAFSLIGQIAVAGQLAALFAACADTARTALERVGALTGLISPLIGTLAAASGRPAGAASFTPLGALAGGLVAGGLGAWVLALAGAAAALGAASSLSEEMRLDALADLALRAVRLLLTASMAAFTGLIGIQGALAKGYDGGAANTARFALNSLLPVVGGEVADSLDALLASAALVKNALGVTGVVVLLGACLSPVARLIAAEIGVRLAAALVEPAGARRATRMYLGFADALRMLSAALICAAVMLIVLIGAGLTLFGGRV